MERMNNGKNWKRADWDGMRLDLAIMAWDRALGGLLVHVMWDIFRSKIDATVARHVPVKKEQRGGRSPWMSREIMAAVRRKKRLWEKAKKGSGVDEYKDADRQVKKMIRTAKRNFERRLAMEKGGNSRPFFSYVKKKTRTCKTIGPLVDESWTSISDNKGMAETLNGFFHSVFTQEDISSIPSATVREMENMEGAIVRERLIREKIKNFKPCSAAGPDGIGPQLLKEFQEEIIPALKLIHRKSLESGEVPVDWRRANMTPYSRRSGNRIREIIVRSPSHQFAADC